MRQQVKEINTCAMLLGVGILLYLVSVSASAISLSELQQANKLQLKSWLEPAEDIVAKQQVKLHIEVATDKWFSGGTRIGRFDIDDAIVLQRESFALNSTRREDGKTWTVQQWTLVVYPQRNGQFTIPAISVNLSIAGDNNKAIRGQVYTNAMSFVAKIPEELLDKDSWVATTRYRVIASFDKPVDNLRPGNALTRTIHITAEDLPAMMLPSVVADDIPGISIYQKPPQVVDKVNRGDYLAERIETISYVFEKSGEYQLPAQLYYWWNLESEVIETIEIPATMLRVVDNSSGTEGVSANLESAKHNKSFDVISLLIKTGVVLVILIIFWTIISRLRHFTKGRKASKSVVISEKCLQRKFDKACREKEFKKAVQIFYQWLDNYGGDLFSGSIRRRLSELDQPQTMNKFNRIMQSIYSLDKYEKIDFRQFAHEFICELKQLDQPVGLRRWVVELKLN